MLVLPPAPTHWELSQPRKRRRVTVDELEQSFLRLTVSPVSPEPWQEVKLECLLHSLTLEAAQKKVPDSDDDTEDLNSPTRWHVGAQGPGWTGGICSPKSFDVLSAASAASSSCASGEGHHRVQCTAIVPYSRPLRRRAAARAGGTAQRNIRAAPLAAPIPRPLPWTTADIARFAVDAKGTAFLLPDSLRSQLAEYRNRNRQKRGRVDSCEDYIKTGQATSTALVLYEKRATDLVADFLTLAI
eukprot:TRINITY_DN17965_c0_g1_i1.p1 TRINITY_DN17965_c0_g1~~TRINITY_DN17965_c0_g1_i1.p1  ORF type:complete len:243 (+),score=36.96 TRINITY_DN17965_c0_g1_i1:108-836(+)